MFYEKRTCHYYYGRYLHQNIMSIIYILQSICPYLRSWDAILIKIAV